MKLARQDQNPIKKAHAEPSVEAPYPTLTATPGWILLQKPINGLTDAEADQVAEVAAAMRAQTQTASRAEIAANIERLANHYHRIERNEREARLWVEDWVEDLSRYPADIIAAACVAWRRSNERYMPPPGPLCALCDDIMAARKFWLGRAERVLRDAKKISARG